jgi:methyl-accepting chemotaxis protein PixJ
MDPVPMRRTYSFSFKMMLGAITLATVPALIVAIIAVNNRLPDDNDPAAAQATSTLVLGTGAVLLGAGAIAAYLAHLALRPMTKVALTTNTLVNRLERRPQTRSAHDHWGTLEKNLEILSQQLPQQLSQQESEFERARIVMNLNGRLREAMSEEEVLRVAVNEIRQVLKADRVALYRLNSDTDGTIVEEAVLPGWPKMLWTTLEDPCLADYLDHYRQGRIRAIDDLYNAGLDDCHIGLLERFAVKANLIAPILKGKTLYGLLIANQCSGPRIWQASEIELYTQLAAQISFSLDHARLLEQADQQTSQAQVLMDVTRLIRTSLNEEDVLRITVEEVRKVLGCDRVMVYSFDEKWYGTVVAESVVPTYPKALRANIYDPCFAEGYVEKYRAGRVQATADISQAGLTDCHLKQLKPYEVKANLVAPILKGDRLFALLIAHQCSAPRNWKAGEIDLFAQVASQVGYALEHARLLERVSSEGEKAQLLVDLTRRIRETLVEENVIKTAVTEMRRVLQADRVMIYQFDADWYGTVIAEAVLPGYPKALWATIKDPCFVEGYVQAYQQGRVQATADIYRAGLTKCHLNQLEPFEVKANLVAPILKNDKLFGLLIAHQCSGPREWKVPEVNLFAQIAIQVGFALDHARLLDQVEQAYQTAQENSTLHQSQRDTLQNQLSQWLVHSDISLQQLSQEMAEQLLGVTDLYQQFKLVHENNGQMRSFIAQQNQLQSQASDLFDEGETLTSALNERFSMVGQLQAGASPQGQHLAPKMQQLTTLSQRIAQVAAKMKLQAMNAALEASRSANVSSEFSIIGDGILDLARQLDQCTSDFTNTVASLEDAIVAVSGGATTESKRSTVDLQLIQQHQKSWAQLVDLYQTLRHLMSEIDQSANQQSTFMDDLQQRIVEVANRANQSSAKVNAIASTISELHESNANP